MICFGTLTWMLHFYGGSIVIHRENCESTSDKNDENQPGNHHMDSYRSLTRDYLPSKPKMLISSGLFFSQ